MNCHDLMKCISRIGHNMLEYGAEVYRVEDSLTRICKSYGAKSVDVFVIPTSLIITLEMPGEEPVTMLKRATEKETDLNKIDGLNRLSRYICENTPDTETILKMIDEIMNQKSNHFVLVTLSYAMVPAVFSMFFGGNLKDAAVAAVIGFLMKFLLDKLVLFGTNTVFINIICGGFGSLIAVLATRLGFGTNYDKIIIGSIMLLVPGLVLTNSMRDFITGDFLAGVTRMIEAILIAMGIAIGIAVVLILLGIPGQVV